MNPKVSVLVPVYNVAPFLSQCLDSLIRQTLKEIQIICINDGSTDGSLDILKAYAARDSRIEIIDKKNSGYGASMNCGLDRAVGEYIGITESDDFASPKMFEKLYHAAKKHDCDLVKSNYYEYCNGKNTPQRPFDSLRYNSVFAPEDNQEAIKVMPIIWAGLYRRHMLSIEGIRFNETQGASFQDTSFVQRVWFAAHRAMLLRGCYLHYRIDNANSSVKSATKVYEVCGEFSLTEEFLRKDSRRFETFMPLLNRMKLDTYRWNYNRIAEEYRLEFARRWASEFRLSQAEGMIRKDQFDEYSWGIASELMHNPDSFFEKYREAL